MPVSWDGDNETGFKVEIQVDAWDRHRLLEDLSRTFAEAGINIVEARCLVQHPMTRNRFVIEVGDTQALKSAITACARSTASSTPTASCRPGRALKRLAAEQRSAHEIALAIVRGALGAQRGGDDLRELRLGLWSSCLNDPRTGQRRYRTLAGLWRWGFPHASA